MREQLKQRRLESKLSQKKLAEIVGVSHQTISHIERGDFNPSIQVAKNILKALGMEGASINLF